MFHVPYVALPLTFHQGPGAAGLPSPRRLLFVGQLIDRKGLIPLTNALSAWATAHPDRRVEFSIVGSGPLQSQLESFRTPENLMLRLLGERSYEELAECYPNADIFVFPSLADEWGLVVNEAMAAGLPVLGSLYSQAAEQLCIEGKTGWTFRPHADGEMEAAIDRALSVPARQLGEMGLAARDSVEHLTPQFAADRLLHAVQGVLEHRTPRQ